MSRQPRMIWGNSRVRYGAVAMTLHWLLAAAILFMLWLGLFMTSLEETDPRTFPLFQLHKSIGLTILVLSLARLAVAPRQSGSAAARGHARLGARELPARCMCCSTC